MEQLRQRARRWRQQRSQSAVVRQVLAERLTYLRPDRLQALERLASEVTANGVPGDFIECGVALGGSTVVLAHSMGPERALHAYDVFGMIPAPTAEDPAEVHERYATIASGQSPGLGGDPYYGYRDDLEQHVAATLARYGHPVSERVQLHKGLFDDTLYPVGPVALAHIDCDWHDPVDTCLQRIGAQLSLGGYMILDDYNDYGGCRSATDRYVAEQPGFELVALASNAAVARRA